MALQHLNFSFQGIPSASIPNEWAHSGVVGSGDLELLIYRRDQQGLVLSLIHILFSSHG